MIITDVIWILIESLNALGKAWIGITLHSARNVRPDLLSMLSFVLVFWRKVLILKLFHTMTPFATPWGESLLKTLWEKEKMLLTSIFSFSQNVFFPIEHLKIAQWNCHLQMLSIWTRLQFCILVKALNYCTISMLFLFFVFVEDNATMSSKRYLKYFVLYCVQNRGSKPCLTQFLNDFCCYDIT